MRNKKAESTDEVEADIVSEVSLLILKHSEQYLDLPPLIAARLTNLMTSTGKDSVRRLTFIETMINIFMGSMDERISLVFDLYAKCSLIFYRFDMNGDCKIEKEECALLM